MWNQIRSRLTYANIITTVALSLAVASSAIAGRNLGNGSPPATSAGSTWFLAGSWNDLPSCTSCELSLPVSGSGSFGSTQNVGNDQLSPNATIVASDLSVRVEVAPGFRPDGSVATRTFLLFYRSDPSHSLRCDISGLNKMCNSGAQTVTIPPNSQLLVDAANFGNAPATKTQLSWRATAQ